MRITVIPLKCLSLLSSHRGSLLYSSFNRPAIYARYAGMMRNRSGANGNYSTTRCTSKDIVNSNGMSKVEAEIEEVKQAIKDVQVVIMNVGDKITKVETDLLGDKLSPSKHSLLTQIITNLMDKEKALIEEKKALMDKEKALRTSDFTEQLTLKPFKFLIGKNRMDFPLSGVGSTTFKREWLINDIADMVLVKDEENKYQNYYWRAPAASGKTVFLNLIGKKLQERGCVVYYLNNSAKLDKFKDNYFHQLAQDAGDKTVVLMIDEVQNNIYSGVWSDILREIRPDNLIVLGVGIPQLMYSSPQFICRFPMEGQLFPMFLTKKDIPEVVNYFRGQSSNKSEEDITKLCEEILAFTNGHLYPFVKIIEHLLNPDTIIEHNVALYLSSQKFRSSIPYLSIKVRCAFFPYILDAATNVLKKMDHVDNIKTLHKLGVLHEGVLISPFLLNEAFLNMSPPTGLIVSSLDESEGIRSCTERIMCAGLYYITAADFQDMNPEYRVVENAISLIWGSNVKHAFSNIMMYFQARTKYEDHSGPGAKPLIDFVFNGRLHLGVEVAVNLDANGVKEHLQRFDDKYKILQQNGVVLHIDTMRSEPVEIKSLDKDSNDKIYTFITSRNELYRGSELIKTIVCQYLKAPFEFPSPTKNTLKDKSE